MLTKPRAVIFDWDNTLVDTWPIIHIALEQTFYALGKPCWDFETTKKRVKKSMRDSFPEIFGDDWQTAGEMYQRHYRQHHLDKLTPLSGALATLDVIQQQKLPMFVVSNKKGANLRQEIAYLGWNDYFLGITGSDDALKDKPHPEPVLHALSPHGFTPARDVWFIGDSDIDLECAKNTDCTAILYGDFAATQPEFSSTHYAGFPFAAYAETHEELVRLFTL
jgi:phosphoglycolate phosphatase